MPLARGIMRMGRINIRPTTATFFPDVINAFNNLSPADCINAPFTVTIRVTSPDTPSVTLGLGLSNVRPSGIVSIINLNDTANTTIAAGSNGAILPQTIINVASTVSFISTGGSIFVNTSSGVQLVTYTGTTSTTFTGCSGGVGTMSTGGSINNSTIGSVLGSGLLVGVGTNISEANSIRLNISGDNTTLAAYYARTNNDYVVSAATNATPIVVTTASPNKLLTGHNVTISGALGNTAANGTFAITLPGTTIAVASSGTTTTDALSNSIALPTGTINVISTSTFPASGTFFITTENGIQTVTYGSKNTTQFLSCTGGTGLMFTGAPVTNTAATLPQSTINVASTSSPAPGFPTSGTFYIMTTAGVQTVTYTGTGATTFTGCSGGTGIMTTGGIVRGASTFSLTGSVGNGVYTANSATVSGPSFESSYTNSTIYSVAFTGTATTITSPAASGSPHVYCTTAAQSITAHVQTTETSPVNVTAGSVNFRLYSDDINFTNLASGTLNPSGNATTTIPANTPVGLYGIQAIYPGGGCNSISNTITGVSTSTTTYLFLSNDPTTVSTPTATGGSTTCVRKTKQFNTLVSSTNLGGPSVGSIYFTAFHPASSSTLTTASTTPAAGAASVTVPVDFFDGYTLGTWTITAHYVGDGYCYSSATSVSSLSITTILNTTTSVIDSISPPNFSKTAGGSVTINATVTSSPSGTLNGTMSFTSSSGGMAGANASLSTASPVSVNLTVLKSAFNVGAGQLVTGTFNGDFAGSDCFDISVTDGYSITVTA